MNNDKIYVNEEYIMEHYKNPSNKGILDNATVKRCEINHNCGDIIDLYLQIDNNKITNVKWNGNGCSISQACMSILSEKIINMDINDILNIRNIKDVFDIEITYRRLKCANLSLLCLHNCIYTYQKKELIGFNELLT